MTDGFMYYMYMCGAISMMVGMSLILIRLISGPSFYDRALAVNSFGTKIVLFLCLFSLIIGRQDGVDIAILYALMNFIATIAILKFFKYRALNVSLADMQIRDSYAELPAIEEEE